MISTRLNVGLNKVKILQQGRVGERAWFLLNIISAMCKMTTPSVTDSECLLHTMWVKREEIVPT